MTNPRSQPDTNPLAPLVTVNSPISAAAGLPVDVLVRIVSRSQVPADIRVTVIGLDPTWVPEPMDLGVANPGETIDIILTLVAERGALGAQYPFTVVVEATPTRGSTTPLIGAAESVLAVDGAERISMSISPSRPTAVFSKKFSVEITNPGSQDREFKLAPSAAAGARVQLRRSHVTIPAERSVSVSGRVRIKRPTFLGGYNTHIFAVAAQGRGAPEFAEATVMSKPMFSRGLTVVLGLVLTVALWAGLAVVFIPKISDAFKPDSGSTTVTELADDAGSGDGSGGRGGGDGSGASDGSGVDGSGGKADGGDGSGSPDGSDDSDDATGGYQLAGTISGPGANETTVTLEPTRMLSATDSGPQPAPGSSPDTLQAFRTFIDSAFGKLTQSALAPTPPHKRKQQLITGELGTFSFSGISAPGYYLLSFAKAGFQKQQFLVNSEDLVEPEPMEISLEPGTGKISGAISTAAGQPVGAATITVSDSDVTLQTSSVSPSAGSGTPGSWAIDQLSTPGSYVVTATAPGFGGASMLVDLDAAGDATVNLTLTPDQGTITGTVTGEDGLGDVGGLGGITVTATNGDITRTATTVTSPELRGTFILPDLPIPGTYTVTMSGDGYLTQTRSVSLSTALGAATVSASLSRADGVVEGMVLGMDANGSDEGGLPGVGLTLASNELTMKTMTTSGAAAGGFRFTGVAPGTYVLTASQFGRVAASVTVELTSAERSTVELVLNADDGSVLPETARIRGQILDARSGGPLTCDRAAQPVPGADCVATVTVTSSNSPAAGDTKQQIVHTVRATSSTEFSYTVPRPDDDSTSGLPPGLYRVTITAPGYERAVTNVQVGVGQTVPAPQVSMPPMGVISGTISTRVGTPSEASCVVAVPESLEITSPLPTVCQPVASNTECEVTGLNGTYPCALTSMGGAGAAPLGTYSIKGLKHGHYQVLLIPGDPEYQYVVEAPPVVKLDVGGDAQFNGVLDRYGRILVQVFSSDSDSGDLLPAKDVALTVAEAPAGAAKGAGRTDENGNATLTGLEGAYVVSATSGEMVATATSEETGLNQTVELSLVLARPLGPAIGRIVTIVGDTAVPVSGAVVTITGVVGYKGKEPRNGMAKVTTDTNGCYAIVPHDWSDSAPLTTGECSDVKAVAALDDLTTGLKATLITERVRIAVDTVTRTTEAYLATATTITSSGSIGEIPAVTVRPQPTPFGNLSLTIAGPSSGYNAPNLGNARVQVLKQPSLANGVSLQAATTNPGTVSGTSSSALTFADALVGQPNLALPGRYELSVSLDDFVTTRIDLLCDLSAASCRFVEPGTNTGTNLELKRLPSMTVTVTAPDDGPIPDWTRATGRQLTGPSSLGNLDIVQKDTSSAGDATIGAITFDDELSTMAASNGTYSFTVSIPGYGTLPVTVTCGVDFETACDGEANLMPLPYFDSDGSTVSLSPARTPLDDDEIPLTGVTAIVSPNPGATIGVDVDTDGNVHWKDTSPGTLDGQVVPGTYSIAYSAPGFESQTASLTCTAGADTCIQSPDLVILKMLPQATGTVTIPLADGATTVNLSGANVTVSGANTNTSTLRLSLANLQVDTVEHTAKADIIWHNTTLPFAGIVRPDTYTVTVNVPGYETAAIPGVECRMSPGSCAANTSLAMNPNPDAADMKLTVLPPTLVRAALKVTGGPAGADPVHLTADSDGNLTWQQGNSPAGVVTPGDTSYKIQVELPDYVMAVEGQSESSADFNCTVNLCEFPSIVLVAPTQLQVNLVGADGEAVGAAQIELGRTGSSTGPDHEVTTPTGTATFASRSTTGATATSSTDNSYTLSVQAAGFEFVGALGSSSAAINCVNGSTPVTGLKLIPGGTTTCTVKLRQLGAIDARVMWAKTGLAGAEIVKEDMPVGTEVTAILLDADETETATKFTGKTGVGGSLHLTGTVEDEGLEAGTWKITTSGLAGYVDFEGHIKIDSDFAMTASSGHTNDLTIDNDLAQIVLQAKEVDLDVTFKAAGAEILPNTTVKLTDKSNSPITWTCTVASGVATSVPADKCDLTGSSPGHVQFSELPPGDYDVTITFTESRYNTVNYAGTVKPTGLDQAWPFTLDAQVSTLVGALQDIDRKPINSFDPAATVQLWKWSCDPATDEDDDCIVMDFDGNQKVTIETANGTFTLQNIANGEYRVIVEAQGYQRSWSDYIRLAAGSPSPQPTITMNVAKVNVDLTLTNGTGGALNLSGATVKLTPESSPHQPANVEQQGSSDGSGKVRFNQLPTGTWTVTATLSAAGNLPFGATVTKSGIVVSEVTTELDIDVEVAKTSLNVKWDPSTACGVDAPGGSIPITLTQTLGSTNKSKSLTADPVGDSAEVMVYLPDGDYSWAVDLGSLTGWHADVNPQTFTVASANDLTSTISLTATETTAPVTVAVTDDTDPVKDVTITATTATGDCNEVTGTTDDHGTAVLQLPGSGSGITWTVTPTQADETFTSESGTDTVTVTVDSDGNATANPSSLAFTAGSGTTGAGGPPAGFMVDDEGDGGPALLVIPDPDGSSDGGRTVDPSSGGGGLDPDGIPDPDGSGEGNGAEPPVQE